jgi:flagellar basal body-associated protein FliL
MQEEINIQNQKSFSQKKKSKKNILIITIVILLSISGIAFGSLSFKIWDPAWNPFRKSPPKEEILPETEKEEKEETSEEKGISFKDVIKECENANNFKSYCVISACDAIGTTEERIERCIEKESSYEKDICLSLITPKTSEVCENMNDKDWCYLSIAEETGDVSMCDKLSPGFNEKAPCYIKIAKENKNPEICKKIESNDYKNWCLAVATGNVSNCDNMRYKKSSCYIDVAKAKDDPLVCEAFEGFSKESFKNSCYTEMAHFREDINLCDNINENYIEACYQEAKNEEEEMLCASISREYSKELCVQEVEGRLEHKKAVEKGDYSICELEEEIENLDYSPEHYKNECYYNFAIEKGDVSLCNKMSLEGTFASDMKISCYWNFIKPIAEELNKNFDKEDKALYDKYCQEN